MWGNRDENGSNTPGSELPFLENDDVKIPLRSQLLMMLQIKVLLRHHHLRRCPIFLRRRGCGLWRWWRRLSDAGRPAAFSLGRRGRFFHPTILLRDPFVHALVHIYVVHVHFPGASLQDLDDLCKKKN